MRRLPAAASLDVEMSSPPAASKIVFARSVSLEFSEWTEMSALPPFYFSFVTLGFVLGDAHANQRAGEPADGATDRGAGECGHNWTGGNQWS